MNGIFYTLDSYLESLTVAELEALLKESRRCEDENTVSKILAILSKKETEKEFRGSPK